MIGWHCMSCDCYWTERSAETIGADGGAPHRDSTGEIYKNPAMI